MPTYRITYTPAASKLALPEQIQADDYRLSGRVYEFWTGEYLDRKVHETIAANVVVRVSEVVDEK